MLFPSQYELKSVSPDPEATVVDHEHSPELKPALALPEDLHAAIPINDADGGPQAWLTLGGGWLMLFATFGYASAFGAYQDFYTRTNTASASRVSWIGSVQIFFMVLIGLPAGYAFDRGHFRKVILAGSVLYTFS